jgi:hypothetical protein
MVTVLSRLQYCLAGAEGLSFLAGRRTVPENTEWTQQEKETRLVVLCSVAPQWKESQPTNSPSFSKT